MPVFFFLFLISLRFSVVADDALQASVRVETQGVLIKRVDTDAFISLPFRAVTPWAAGDQLMTNETGRAWMNLGDTTAVVVPFTDMSLREFAMDETPRIDLELTQGVILMQTVRAGRYVIETPTWVVEADSAAHFAVWQRLNQAPAVSVAVGHVEVTRVGDAESVTVRAGGGVFLEDDTMKTVRYPEPWNDFRMIAASRDCEGVVRVFEPYEALRIRSGAGFEHFQTGLILNTKPIFVVGRTFTGGWLRVVQQNNYGWMKTEYLLTECTNIPTLDDNIREQLYRLVNVGEDEIEFLRPFYGLPIEDVIFFVSLPEVWCCSLELE